MFIADIGINHNGDIDIAKKLIKISKEAGVDVVKFQKRNPDKCVPKQQKHIMRETPWGKMPYIAYKHKIEFGKKEFDTINEYCKKLNIKWTASVWDADSLAFILQYDVPFIKIPSACITYTPLLGQVNTSNKPVIISTGMSTKLEIEKAISQLDRVCRLGILHCNSTYPTQPNEMDLNTINTLKNQYKDCTIGYSGHEMGSLATMIAKTLGAEIIERHITLDKTMWGSDHACSLEPNELKDLISTLKQIPIMLGKHEKPLYDSEGAIRKKLRKV